MFDVFTRRKSETRRFLTLVILTTFLLIVASPVLAAPNPPVSKEEALKIAKANVNIPGNLKLNNISYRYEQNGSQVWSFSWNSADRKNPYDIYADVDAVTGRLINFNCYNQKYYQGRGKLSLKKAQEIALNFIKKYNSSEYDQLRMEPPVSVNMGTPDKPQPDLEFNFRFTRIINGYPYWENGVSISVSGINGDVKSYSFNWDPGEIPAVVDTVYMGRAKQLFNEKVGFEFGYLKLWNDGNPTKDAILGYYYPDYASSMYVDAGSAEVIDSSGNPVNIPANLNQPVNAQTYSTPADKDLKMEEAIALAKKWVSIPSDYILNNTWYNENSLGTTSPAWNFTWTGPTNQGSVSVGVDASTGEITSVDAMTNQMREPRSEITDDAAQKIAEDFLREFAPGKLNKIRKDNNYITPDYGVIPKPGEKRPYYTYHFSRLVNGLPFKDNGASVTVNGEGKVTSYWLTWEELKYSSPDNVVSSQKAAALLNSRAGFELGYARLPDGKGGWKTRMVYRINLDPGFFVDAKTGEIRNKWSYNVVIKPKFGDIKGHWAEKDITLLTELQIIESAGAFKPDKTVTRLEAVKMLVRALELNRYYPAKPNFTDIPKDNENYGYAEAACKAGIIKGGGKFNPGVEISREELAVMLAKGLKPINSGKGPTLDRFKDSEKISSWAKSDVLAAVRAGLFTWEKSDKFRPQQKVTKAEMAAITARLLAVQPQ